MHKSYLTHVSGTTAKTVFGSVLRQETISINMLTPQSAVMAGRMETAFSWDYMDINLCSLISGDYLYYYAYCVLNMKDRHDFI